MAHTGRMPADARTEALVSERLVLEPLTIEHATAMVDVLADQALYEYVGGEPPTLAQLHDRYAAQVTGVSPDGSQRWFNWIVKRRDSDALVGYVQATVEEDEHGPVAEVAWVITPRHQGQGLASEAAQAMIRWLRSHGITRIAASVHPNHGASSGVARRVGLHPTEIVEDGEIRWESAT